MSEEVKKTKKTKKPVEEKPVFIGLDIGTMNLVMNNGKKVKSMRNVFLPIDENQVQGSVLDNVAYTEIEDQIVILGQDAFDFCNIFGKEAMRPMKDGLISNEQIDGLEVLGTMIKALINSKSKDITCCFCIPGAPIDQDRNVIYHERVLTRLIKSIGCKPVAINEALAVIFSECEDTTFSGLAFSFGSGMSNVCAAYKGMETASFSVARGGDWIDSNVASAVNSVQSQVTKIKESGIDLNDWTIKSKNRKEKRIKEALKHYYEELIEYAVENIVLELEKKLDDMNFPDEMPIVLSGGTSLPEGFIDLFGEVLETYKDRLPFDISEIRYAEDQLNAVANGCYIRSQL